MHKLNITQYKSSAYQPESQGALERFHQTLNTMIMTYCLDTEKDWDEGIHLPLFVVRELVQESLGFSPFELVFGHTVGGPMKRHKEKLLLENKQLVNLLEYFLFWSSDFQTILSNACELARTNWEKAQKKMKEKYDLPAQERSFRPGDQVLALLPCKQGTMVLTLLREN